jgi:hypothetical protein
MRSTGSALPLLHRRIPARLLIVSALVLAVVAIAPPSWSYPIP